MSADELLAEVLAAIGTYDPLMFSDQHRELFERAATTGARVEPPEVEAAELAAAEEYARALAAGEDGFGPTQQLEPLLDEYNRMRAELHAREFAASYQAATIGRLRRDRDKLQVDLARALPVVAAAEALVEHHDFVFARHRVNYELMVMLDALARAVRA